MELLKDKALLDPAWTLEAVASVLDNSGSEEEWTMYEQNERLISLVVQVYTHAYEPAVRHHAMDIFDRLIAGRSEITTGILADFDRR
jgi:hypothetical protein